MKMVAEYLEHAIHFEQMAAESADEELKETLLAQARAYHKMAAERARRLNVKMPPRSKAKRSTPCGFDHHFCHDAAWLRSIPQFL